MINEFLGVDVVIKYLITNNVVSAYSWHYTEDKALSHLRNYPPSVINGGIREISQNSPWKNYNL